MFPEPVPDRIVEHKEYLLPRWAYSDEEWDRFTSTEQMQGYYIAYHFEPGFINE